MFCCKYQAKYVYRIIVHSNTLCKYDYYIYANSYHEALDIAKARFAEQVPKEKIEFCQMIFRQERG